MGAFIDYIVFSLPNCLCCRWDAKKTRLYLHFSSWESTFFTGLPHKVYVKGFLLQSSTFTPRENKNRNSVLRYFTKNNIEKDPYYMPS